ncbi:hypothetical protein WR25_14909 [Diploscapter pachys]|uniref:Uncharacterized protein n=1 Tax=Diploscapter pachys TaxID=2018661 RepID=A0A2A2J424_9BILA|nr:hypothetical protein WR25_14909 [Diploscapter pachys]
MDLRQFLSPSQLRFLVLRQSNEDKALCLSLTRFLSAFYRDLPLFYPPYKQKTGVSSSTGPGNEADACFPSLFIWSQLTKDEVEMSALDRESLIGMFPIEYSPALPVILFSHFGSFIEAIFYADSFNDIRTSLLMRVFVDSQRMLNLTDEFVDSLCRDLTAQTLSSSSTSNSLDDFCSRCCHSLVQLDIVLQRPYIHKFESFLLDQLEVIFAQLPLEVEPVSMLPRPPIYLNQQNEEWSECQSRESMFCLIRLLLHSMKESNRIASQLSTAFDLLSNSETNEINQFAILYKSLLNQAEESDGEILQRFMRESCEDDVEQANLFFKFVEEHFPHKSNIPPLTSGTREIWYRVLEERNENDYRRREGESNEWICSHIRPAYKVHPSKYRQMDFIANDWLIPSKQLDKNLISMRLCIQPSDICTTKINKAELSSYDYQMSQSARVDDTDKMFTPRAEMEQKTTSRRRIIAEYAKRGEVIRQERQRRAEGIRYLHNTLNDRIQEMTSEQDALIAGALKETSFLEERQNSSTEVRKFGTVVEPFVSAELSRNIETLNQKLDKIVDRLENLTIAVKESENEPETDAETLHSFDPPLDYYATTKPAEAPPPIEKLDLSALTDRTDNGKSGIEELIGMKQQTLDVNMNLHLIGNNGHEKIWNNPNPMGMQYGGSIDCESDRTIREGEDKEVQTEMKLEMGEVQDSGYADAEQEGDKLTKKQKQPREFVKISKDQINNIINNSVIRGA